MDDGQERLLNPGRSARRLIRWRSLQKNQRQVRAVVTKSREKGENELTEEAKREATRSGNDVCDILAAWLKVAKAAGDKDRQEKIKRAQKYLGCRNKRKRKEKS